MTPPEAAPRLLDHDHRAITVGLVAFITLIAFEGTALITALPVVARDLDALGLLAWILNAFIAASLIGQVMAGGWGDRFGPRRPLLAGIAVFGLGGLVGGLATGFPMLLAGRALQGLGAGTMIVLAYVVIGRAYDHRLRPKAFSLISAAWVLPSIVGPVVAGYVADQLSWRWLFLAVVVLVWPPVLIVTTRLRQFDGAVAGTDPHPPGHSRRRARLGVQAAVALLAVQDGAQRADWLGALEALVGVALLVPAFRALTPTGTLRAGRGLPAVVVMRGLLAGAYFGAEAWVPVALQDVRGVSTAWSGMFLAVGALGWASGAYLQGHPPRFLTPSRFVRVGSTCVLLCLVLLPLSLVPALPPAVLGLVWVIGSFGMGMAISSVATLLLEYSAPGEQGVNSSGLQVADSTGVVLVTGVTGAVFAVSVAGGAVGAGAFAVMWWMTAVVALVAAVVSPRVLRPRV